VIGVLLSVENERPLSEGTKASCGAIGCLKLGLERVPLGLEWRFYVGSRLGLEFSLLELDILGSEIGLCCYALSCLKVGILYYYWSWAPKRYLLFA
jgi:hypothetical protein